MSAGRTLRLFLVDGSPSGLVTAEIMNWTGHVLTGPRSLLVELLKRSEISRTGVYFLIGPDAENPVRLRVYIGETDDVASRLKQHNRGEEQGGKDFWERVCVVTSKDHNLTKAHVKHLESQLISAVKEAGRARLENGNLPDYTLLPEADIADMAYFLDQIQTVLPVLGFDFLRKPLRLPNSTAQTSESVTSTSLPSPYFIMTVPKYKVSARALEIDGDFVVLKGSMARDHWASAPHSYESLYRKLVQDGVLDGEFAGVRIFKTDYAFSSPSAAAAVVSGRPNNGRVTWITEGDGRTYAEWQEEQLLVSSPDKVWSTEPA